VNKYASIASPFFKIKFAAPLDFESNILASDWLVASVKLASGWPHPPIQGGLIPLCRVKKSGGRVEKHWRM
jgi:hypothetical protein